HPDWVESFGARLHGLRVLKKPRLRLSVLLKAPLGRGRSPANGPRSGHCDRGGETARKARSSPARASPRQSEYREVRRARLRTTAHPVLPAEDASGSADPALSRDPTPAWPNLPPLGRRPDRSHRSPAAFRPKPAPEALGRGRTP